MRLNKLASAAMDIGHKQAETLLRSRRKVKKARAKVLAQLPSPQVPGLAATESKAAASTSTRNAGWLVAEGDSWFDYPFHDVLKILEDDYGYEVESVAHKGDTIEGMAYEGSQLSDFIRRLEKMLRYQQIPKAVLLSGGGNDVAGDEFAILLNHINSPEAGFNQRIVDGVINERVRSAYITIIGAVSRVCEEMLGRQIPILVHGYDYPVPDGRGFAGGWGPLPGPWLEPGFQRKGFTGRTPAERQKRIKMLKAVMDRFNDMLSGVVSLSTFAHVHHVDLRETLSYGVGYEKWWANELHPTKKGFELVTAKYQTILSAL